MTKSAPDSRQAERHLRLDPTPSLHSVLCRRRAEIVIDSLEEQGAPLDRRFAVAEILPIEHGEVDDGRSDWKLPPAEIDVIQVLADTEAIPEMNFDTLARIDRAFDDLGVRIVVLHHARGRI